MATLILCGLTDAETPEFLKAERSLLDETIPQKGLSAEYVHTLRLKEFPDPADPGEVDSRSRELLGTFDLGSGEFKTEFLEKDGFKFLAIHTPMNSLHADAPIPVTEKPVRPPRRINWMVPVKVLGGLVLLVLFYFGLGFLLTKVVNGQFADRNCKGLVGIARFVELAYPLQIAPFTESVRPQRAECRAYLAGESLREQKNWEKAYQSYRRYGEIYPAGIYVKEAKELTADSLFEMAGVQRGNGDYAIVVDNLMLVLNQYGDTPAMSKAKATLPEVYMEWGQARRTTGKFEEAETVYQSMSAWAKEQQDDALVTGAASELAEAYFEWGRHLQDEQDFDGAFSKFNLALETDPDPESADGTTAQTNAHLPGFQRDWGVYLLAAEKYPDAIRHYEISVNLSDPKDVESIKNELALAYLQWADSLRKSGDFKKALEKLGLAEGSTTVDADRLKIGEARTATLDQFSHSTDSQARGAITDAAKSFCMNKQRNPLVDPPIFAILEPKQMALYGVGLTLPAGIRAPAPGNLHFVACATEKQVVVQTCPFSKTGFGVVTHWIKRIRYDWIIQVYSSQDAKLIREETFRGTSPESCPHRHTFFSTTDYFYGNKPTPDPIIDWLASLLE